MDDDDAAAVEGIAELERTEAFEEIGGVDVIVGAAIKVESYDLKHQYVSAVLVHLLKHTLC